MLIPRARDGALMMAKHHWVQHGDKDHRGWRRMKCARCGLLLHPTPHEPHQIHAKACSVLGWGDYVSAFLSLFGITKSRVNWFTTKLVKRDCGCDDRQEAINDAGWRITGWAKRLLTRAAPK